MQHLAPHIAAYLDLPQLVVYIAAYLACMPITAFGLIAVANFINRD